MVAPLDTVQSEYTSAPETGSYYTTAPKATGIADKIALDSNETKEILARMQEFIDQREGPLNQLMGGLNKAYATTYGPGAALEYQKQQDVEDKQIMDYRTQMAAYRAAQKQADIDAADYAKKMGGAGTTGAISGAAPSTGAGMGVTTKGVPTWDGIPIPPSVSSRFKEGPGSVAYNRAIINEWQKTETTETIKKEQSPAMAAIVDVFGVGQMTLAQAEKYLNKQPNLQAVVNGQKVPLASVVSNAIKQDTAPAAPAAAKPAAPVQGAPAPAAPVQGAPAPAAPVQGAPAAAMPAPVTKPAAAMPAPVAKPAAPVQGAPAPAAPVQGAPAAPAPAAIKPSQVVVGPPEPPVASNYIGRQSEFNAAKEKWQKDYDTYNATKQELGKSNIASIKEEADKFIARTDGRVLEKRQGDNNYLGEIIKKWHGNSNVAGVLNEPTWGNAIATALQKGISTPGGNISMPDIVEILQKTKPGATEEEIEASKEIARILGQRILDVVQQSKGSTSDRDWMAFKQIAGTADNGWDALYKIQRYDEETLKTDKKERKLFDSSYNGQTFDYNKHIINPKRIELYENYGKSLSEINRSHFKVEPTPPRPDNVPQGAMYNPNLKKWGWYDKNKKWTTN